ncbi:hypothetical protein GCM10025787_00180 [Saccharopolyspora rosea]|uniref:T7SS-secreted protein n=1 Tax=Saccharopolyspora rosea TaxID=524884 RepID=A0ABW3FRG4_9PSEU
MSAELGQTSNPKGLVPGEPNVISTDLRSLVGDIRQVSAIKDGLRGIEPAQWTGAASEAFRKVFSAVPAQWQEAVETVGAQAQALADFGDVLTWGQREAQRAIEQYTRAQAATRAAAAQYNAQAQQAESAGQTMAPFQDPGQAAAQEAQQILDNAREKVQAVGDLVAKRLGFTKNKDGSYTKTIGDPKTFGGARRDKEKKWDKEKKKEVEKDPGGWQRQTGGSSFKREYGNPGDGLITDDLKGVLGQLGIDTSESTVAASAGVDFAHGSLAGSFNNGTISGSGKLDGSMLGANAEAHAGASALGVSAGASAEAYLAKGHAEGEVKAGPASAKGSGDAMVGAAAKADGQVTWAGAQGKAEAFAGARATGDVSAEVAGVGAGVHAEGWAGAGAEASGQFGMGSDGKFHVGGSVGLGLGLGGKVGFNVSVDPGEVAHSVQSVAGDVGHVASDVGHGIANSADSVGHALGF